MTALEPTWPKDRRVILRHLPGSERWDVRLFGAHARLKRQVETVPENWNLSTVAGPRDLNGLDYWGGGPSPRILRRSSATLPFTTHSPQAWS